MTSRVSVLLACGFLGGCVATNPYYLDPTTATTTSGGVTTGGVTTEATTSETVSEASSEPETTGPTPTEMTTSPEPACGNEVLDPGEECDEGLENGEGECNSKCELAYCGDGEEAPGEDCDDGEANGTPDSACTFFCEAAECGDSQVSLGEECDHGENNVSADGFACNGDCQENYCGDGFLSPDEACDPINVDLLYCDDCTLKKCGDGKVFQPLEQCDTGMNDPLCLPNCMYAPESVGLVGEEVEAELIGYEVGPEMKIECVMSSMVGLHGKIDVDELWLGQVGPRCGIPDLKKLGIFGYTVIHENVVDGEAIGPLPEEFELGVSECAEEEALVGIVATEDEYITSLAAICIRVKLVAVLGSWKIVPHFPVLAEPIGFDGDAFETSECPFGHAVSRVSVYADVEGITGLQVYCKKIGF